MAYTEMYLYRVSVATDTGEMSATVRAYVCWGAIYSVLSAFLHDQRDPCLLKKSGKLSITVERAKE